jgi:DNA-binding CsgD family transcriptional regulator/tetratricopeptide (TPR) repeat protein
VLRVAAVVGRRWEPALLARVMGLDVERVEELLLAAARWQVARREGDGAYAFGHDMVRETLSAEVGGARRRRLHLAIGEALEAQGGAGPDRRLADLAYHFGEAGAVARAVPYALACGERALRASAAAQAEGHYRTAVRLLGPGEDGAQRALALTGLGDAATLRGDYALAAEAHQGAAAAWWRSGDARSAARAWHRLGRVRWRQEAVGDARAAFERALELLGATDGPDAAETLLQLADLHATSLGRHAEGIAYAERALDMVERLGERRLEATACRVVGDVKARGDDLGAGRAMLERALALAQELDDPALGAEACADLANVYAWTAETERSIWASVLRAELAQRTQDLFHLRDVYSWIGLQEALRGKWPEAEQRFAQQEPIVEGLPTPEPRAELRSNRGILRYLQGRFAEAEAELRAAVDLLRPTGGTLVWCLGWQGQALAELGRRDEALDCFAELHALADALDERARARGNAFANVAVGYARLGLAERAAACYPKLLPFRGQLSPILIDRGLGVAALARGDLAAAERHLADAEALARRAGMRPELALTLLQRGLLERDHRREDPTGGARRRAPAGGPLAEGLRLSAALGIEELGRRMLRPAGAGPGGRSGRQGSVGGLSPRELEVLRLVAEGRTNREIAETLVLSQDTVARHLTHIFTKIGVENRAGATAYALRHGLA